MTDLQYKGVIKSVVGMQIGCDDVEQAVRRALELLPADERAPFEKMIADKEAKRH